MKTWEDIQGWFNYEAIYDMMLERCAPGGTIVEIGVWKGRSLAYMAKIIQKQKPGIKLYGVDTFVGSREMWAGGVPMPSFYEEVKKNLTDCGTPTELLNMLSVQAATLFKNKTVDSVFVDGSHETQDVLNDIDAWLPKIKPGGILAGHDYTTTVAMAVDARFSKSDMILSYTGCWVYPVQT